MLYIRKFYTVKKIYISIYIHRWDTGTQLQWRVTNMARNDFRPRGGLGGAKRPQQLGVGVARSATSTASIKYEPPVCFSFCLFILLFVFCHLVIFIKLAKYEI